MTTVDVSIIGAGSAGLSAGHVLPLYPGFIEGAVRSGQDVAARLRQQG